MFSKIKKTVFTSQFYVFMLLGGSIMINACQEQESAQPQMEEVQYEMYDDAFVTVVLDPNKVHEFHSFESLEEHDNYLLAIEERGEKVVVNKKMWQDLSHYFDPYQLTVMDMNYEIEVANERFKADREALYKKTAPDLDWELYVFYGLSGKVDLEETAFIHESILELNKLTDFNFKSPAAKQVYQKLSTNILNNGRAETPQYEYKYAKNDTGENYEFAYRWYSPTGTLYHAHMRVYCWNEKYTNWGKKGKGGTYFQINRYEENGGSSTWTTMTNGSIIGDYHENGLADTSVPYTKVYVETNKGSKTDEEEDWQSYVQGVNRGNDRVNSNHWANVRANDSNTIKRTVVTNYFVE